MELCCIFVTEKFARAINSEIYGFNSECCQLIRAKKYMNYDYAHTHTHQQTL